MRKSILILIIALAAGFTSYAQNVGINNDGSPAAASAILDVKSSNKGMLVPRVSLTGTDDAVTIDSPVTSLLVYNTAFAGAGNNVVEPGYYYWNGSTWSRILVESSSTSSWKMGGNAGTTPGTHFIGTTDNKPLIFKVNNMIAAHIDINNVNTFFGYQAGKSMTTGWGSIGIGQHALGNTTTGFDNIAIGEGTLATNTTGVNNMAIGKFAMTATTTGTENIGIGNNTLGANTTGSGNTTVGIAAMAVSTTGHSNTTLGRTTMRLNTEGYENTAIGRSALYNNTTGFQNTAIGRDALLNTTTGSQNTAVGFRANVNAANAINATAIGANALANCNNCVVIGSINTVNGATSDVNVGIGTNTPTNPLSFKAALGEKISLWNGGGANHYGIGVQSGLMQLYTDSPVADVAFGYGNSTTFSETMRIKGNGNVGIGTNIPNNLLEIQSNSDFNRTHIRLHEQEIDFTRIRMSNTSNHFWDLAAKPDPVKTNAFLSFYYSGHGMNILSLRGDGNGTLTGVFTHSSDIRFKKDIAILDGALSKILSINGYRYHWKDERRDKTLQVGVIAQEIQAVLPELVKEDENGMLSVNYSGLVPVLIEAVKEQQKQISALQKENEELKKMKEEITELKRLIQQK